MRQKMILAAAALAASSFPAWAEDDPHVAACREAAVAALREKTPDVKDVILDMDSLIIAKADSKIETIPVKGVITGDAYLRRTRATSRATWCASSARRTRRS